MRDRVGAVERAHLSGRRGTLTCESDQKPLSKLALFVGVDHTLVRSTVENFKTCNYMAGEVLIEIGKRSAALTVIDAGIVELCRPTASDDVAVLLLAANDLIMPAAVVLEEPSLICARALTQVTTFEINAASLRESMAQSSQLTFNMLKIVSGQWRVAVRSILDLGSRTAAQRLGAFLLRLADIHEGAEVPILPIAKRSLAARIGIAPETLSRTLQTVADQGLYLRGRAIVVRDRARIEHFCGPDPYPCTDERALGVYAF